MCTISDENLTILKQRSSPKDYCVMHRESLKGRIHKPLIFSLPEVVYASEGEVHSIDL